MAAYFNIYALFLFFNFLNLAVLGLVIAVSCQNVIRSPTNVIIYNAYTGFLCLLLFFAEFRLPGFVHEYLRFLCTYRGRGLLYTFFGCLVYANTVFNIVACVLVVTVGVAYFIISWVPMASPSFGLLENWRAWTHQGTRNLYRNTTSQARKPDRQNSKYVDLTSHHHRQVAEDILEYHEDQFMTDIRGDDIEMLKADLQRHPTTLVTTGGVHTHTYTAVPLPPELAHKISSASKASSSSSSSTSGPTITPSSGITSGVVAPPTLNTTNPFQTTSHYTYNPTSLAIHNLALELERDYPHPRPYPNHPSASAHDDHEGITADSHFYEPPSGEARYEISPHPEWSFHAPPLEVTQTTESDRTLTHPLSPTHGGKRGYSKDPSF
ncbi:COPI associated protein-domain-containing protein [Dimargaris cristalligena]|uniref:COPI associated protein-domain-containing protein n=1 Tax=Dimargaris cristalligena TaxID=215637 RepID=A0A4P9ZTG3_9FUNG|nr:COPI associated protein-domain-containing protein [Dimargaris cristalligena]|eukprot:RKP36508.1 COPI associated protein-domain-containing protein [Dimargaris cristalligena]